eukprot:8155457-Pyramimonas_sp.AAC.1
MTEIPAGTFTMTETNAEVLARLRQTPAVSMLYGQLFPNDPNPSQVSKRRRACPAVSALMARTFTMAALLAQLMETG